MIEKYPGMKKFSNILKFDIKKICKWILLNIAIQVQNSWKRSKTYKSEITIFFHYFDNYKPNACMIDVFLFHKDRSKHICKKCSQDNCSNFSLSLADSIFYFRFKQDWKTSVIEPKVMNVKIVKIWCFGFFELYEFREL